LCDNLVVAFFFGPPCTLTVTDHFLDVMQEASALFWRVQPPWPFWHRPRETTSAYGCTSFAYARSVWS